MNPGKFLDDYLINRPLFLSLIRAKEASLYSKYLPLNKPVLDIGCGDGFFAQTVFGKLDTGIDMPDSRLNEAKQRQIYKNLISFDGERIPFGKNKFSTVICNCVLEHVSSLDKLLIEMHRIVKPGGEILLTVMAKPWEDYLFGNLILGDFYKKWMRQKQVHVNIKNHQQWVDSFRKSGFKVIDQIGYLPKSFCRLIDICHYVSFPSLITYHLFRRWVILPAYRYLLPRNYILKFISKNCSPDKSGAIFYKLIRD